MPRLILAMLGLLVVAGCTTMRETSPGRTATEQLLISAAADRAARDVALKMPGGAKVHIDTSYFEGFDSKYAIGALREEILKHGALLAPTRADADIVVELRAGALSLDEDQTLVGIPEINIPIPLTQQFGLPEIALFKRHTRRGVAKFAALAYSAVDGRLIAASEPQFGYSHQTDWVILLFFAWTTTDVVPPGEEDEIDTGYSLPSPRSAGKTGRSD